MTVTFIAAPEILLPPQQAIRLADADLRAEAALDLAAGDVVGSDLAIALARLAHACLADGWMPA